MLVETRIPVGFIAKKAWRGAISAFLIAFVAETLVAYRPQVVPPIQLALPAFLGTAISLLLSFKLNQSYDRWWEARKIWGAIVNDSRTLVIQALSFTSDGGDPEEAVVRIARRQIAWCHCLGQSLRGLDWKVGAAAYLSERDASDAGRHTNKSLALVQQQARDVQTLATSGAISDYRRVALDQTLTRLVDSMGKAERIRSTVFPRTYRIFLHLFLYVFLTILAFALAEMEGAWAIAITTLVALPFLLLEKTALHMQDPFANRPTDTPVTQIARTIEINLLELVGAKDVPPPIKPDTFYVM